MSSDAEKIEELTAIIQTVRDRVRARYPQPQNGVSDSAVSDNASHAGPRIRIPIADLLPVVHARDAAQAKIAAIGSVNPRSGGLSNRIIQFVKKTIARSLQWFVRDQITFNREAVSALEAVLEALNDHNRVLISLAAQTTEHMGYAREELAARVRELSAQTDVRAGELGRHIDLRANEIRAFVQPVVEQVDLLKAEAAELKDVRCHWIEWRTDWERKLSLNEVQFLRSVADLQGSFLHRSTLMESGLREQIRSQHDNYLGALDRANLGIQQRLWADLEKIRMEYDRLIHTELRLIRQRGFASRDAPSGVPATVASPPAGAGNFDYGRFAERFRGSEEYVRRNQEFYRPFFAGRLNVLDIGCGRGEFLQFMGDLGVPARGIDLSEESVARCRQTGSQAEQADVFEYLANQPDGEFDGMLVSQVVEHIPPEVLPELVRLCAAKLNAGGVLAIETPNPECLAIFATHFYLDPTHTRPVPHSLLAFYMEESGFGQIEVHPLSPAAESIPEVAELPESFRERFFGGLDYAIIGRKL
jgi:2-polyprenyl-3-methyl-5-hydroxy-6-metoxy-1,4-benzoquinol methylase